MTIKEQIERESKKLWVIQTERHKDIDCDFLWNSHMGEHAKGDYRRMSKYVLAERIKARIEELTNQLDRIGLCGDDAMERINQLTEQLKEIEQC